MWRHLGASGLILILAARWPMPAGPITLSVSGLTRTYTPGSTLAFNVELSGAASVQLEVGDAVRTLKVAAIYQADGQHLGVRVSFVLPSGQLKDKPATWYGGVHIDPKQVAAMERALFAAYPSVTVINIADVLERIESVVDQITFVKP